MKYRLLFVLVIILSACSQSSSINDRHNKIIDVFGSIGNEEIVPISEIADHIEYIPLETYKNSVISNPDDIILANDMIYIKGRSTEPIMIFDRKGNFLSSFERRGRSNEEYESIVSMIVDDNGTLCIESSQKISEYKPDGTFIRNIPKDSQVYYRGFAKLNENFYLLSSALGMNFTNSYTAIDSESHVLWNKPFSSSEESVLKTFPRADMFKKPYRFKDRIMISSGMWDHILSVNEKLEIDTLYFFNYGDYKPTEDNIKELANEKKMMTRQSDILESDRYIFLKYNIGNLAKNKVNASPKGSGKKVELPLLYIYFDKQDGSTTSLMKDSESNLGFIDDINNGGVIWPLSISEDNQMVSFIPAHEFKESFAGKQDNPEISKYAESISDNDNHVVVIVKLKK